MHELGSTLRVLQPDPRVLAFYDGRVPGVRAFSPEPNWLDDGAYQLGIASYAIVDGAEALVYDTHMSIPHARLIRSILHKRGVRHLRVVLSHWHTDHIAGNAVFEDCEIIAHELTLSAMQTNRASLAAGSPSIDPLVLPTVTYTDRMDLAVGRLAVELRHADIHSKDGTVLLLDDGLMLAGDTLEDSVTYVAEPADLQNHLADLSRMAGWPISRILPNHGDPDRIEAAAYGKSLITATQFYIERLLRLRHDPDLSRLSLPDFVRNELQAGWITAFAPYEAVHRRNICMVEALHHREESDTA